MPATKVRKLYAFAHGNKGGGAHAIIIEFEQFPDLRDSWSRVTDAHGNEWDVRKADCGAGCRCAAEARAVSYGQSERIETSERPAHRLAFTPSMAIVVYGDEPEVFEEPADALAYLYKRISADGVKDGDTTKEAKARAVWAIAAAGEQAHQMKILWTATTGYRIWKEEPED